MRGFTLVELMMVIAISLVMLSLTFPAFSARIRDSQFETFAAELAGHLVYARHQAQVNETSFALDFEATTDYRYACLMAEDENWTLVSLSPWRHNYFTKIRNQLPTDPLPHPTQKKVLDTALSSTHAPRVIFGPRGSSSGTIVFSDGKGRALCVVVSGQTGRFRVYIRTRTAPSWRKYY